MSWWVWTVIAIVVLVLLVPVLLSLPDINRYRRIRKM